MDLSSPKELNIIYRVKTKETFRKYRNIHLKIDEDQIFDAHHNFGYLSIEQKNSIVKQFIEKDRRRYATKEYELIEWEDIYEGSLTNVPSIGKYNLKGSQ